MIFSLSCYRLEYAKLKNLKDLNPTERTDACLRKNLDSMRPLENAKTIPLKAARPIEIVTQLEKNVRSIVVISEDAAHHPRGLYRICL